MRRGGSAASPEQLAEASSRGRRSGLSGTTSSWNLKPDEDLSGYAQARCRRLRSAARASWGEIAAESRSQHKSQGFGVGATRGPSVEYFQPLDEGAGRTPTAGHLRRARPHLAPLARRGARGPGRSSRRVARLRRRAPRARRFRRSSRSTRSRARAGRRLEGAASCARSRSWCSPCAGLFVEARAAEAAAAPGSQVARERRWR